jgi:hypothetical protein
VSGFAWEAKAEGRGHGLTDVGGSVGGDSGSAAGAFAAAWAGAAVAGVRGADAALHRASMGPAMAAKIPTVSACSAAHQAYGSLPKALLALLRRAGASNVAETLRTHAGRPRPVAANVFGDQIE